MNNPLVWLVFQIEPQENPKNTILMAFDNLNQAAQWADIIRDRYRDDIRKGDVRFLVQPIYVYGGEEADNVIEEERNG